MAAAASGREPTMEPRPQDVVNDQTGEASPGVADRAVEESSSEIPVSPTPEPPETVETTEAAERRSPDR
jgi:hypothetical protein